MTGSIESIDDALGEIQILSPEEKDDAPIETQACWPDGWWAVADGNGVVAYFGNEADAAAFRLMQVNTILNGKATLTARGLV